MTCRVLCLALVFEDLRMGRSRTDNGFTTVWHEKEYPHFANDPFEGNTGK